MKKGNVKVNTTPRKEIHPLHLILQKINPSIVDNLPAGHSLSGCDTVAKVGTKKGLIKALEVHSGLIHEFGKDRLDEDINIKCRTISCETCINKV